ncbi:substrate-binding domain-containing protein [Leifsonia sp. NPDC058292]|uniref:substrate-binding domain-containing protein n=1 Tax=Leifsonia sp. NPDC058292 TaxID=3346428 RepID=UPI0036DCF96E
MHHEPDRSPARPTLERIALDASVSVSTVSKVLNGREGVSTRTRQAVETLLAESGYARRGSESEPGSLVELVIESLDSDWALAIIRGVERVAREAGLTVALTARGDPDAPRHDWITGVLRRKPIALVLVFSGLSAEHRQQLHTRNISFVVVDPAGDPDPELPSIGATNWAGGHAATRHLLALGHRRIGVISGPTGLMFSRARVAGHRSALEEARIPVDPELIRVGKLSRRAGEREARQLLALENPPTAIFTGNDQQAFGVYDAAAALGLVIPDDLSVVGFDDIPPAQWLTPPLTTVRQPLVDIAEEATRLALRMRVEHVPNVRLELATTLVERGSTARPSR